MNQNTRTNKTESTVDETITEALLMADFFALAHQGQDTTPLHGLDQELLDVTKEYLTQPIGIEVFGGPVAKDKHRG